MRAKLVSALFHGALMLIGTGPISPVDIDMLFIYLVLLKAKSTHKKKTRSMGLEAKSVK